MILFGIDPDLDTPRAFLSRLGGLIKHVIHNRGGQTSLAALAAAMAQSKATVRLGLAVLAGRNQIAFTLSKKGAVAISYPSGREQPGDAALQRQQAQLYAQLEETAAYRTYFTEADATRLVNP